MAFAYDKGIEGNKVVDESLVDFRFFSLEKSIKGCCLIETNEEERINYGDEFGSEMNEFLQIIQQIINE